MNNLLKKLQAWFKPRPKSQVKPKFKPINYQYYAKLIKKLTHQMSQNERKRRVKC